MRVHFLCPESAKAAISHGRKLLQSLATAALQARTAALFVTIRLLSALKHIRTLLDLHQHPVSDPLDNTMSPTHPQHHNALAAKVSKLNCAFFFRIVAASVPTQNNREARFWEK